jgi:hypothetical protein
MFVVGQMTRFRTSNCYGTWKKINRAGMLKFRVCHVCVSLYKKEKEKKSEKKKSSCRAFEV